MIHTTLVGLENITFRLLVRRAIPVVPPTHRCWTCDREVMGSNPARGCCAPRPTQHIIPPGSVNEYQRKLGSKRKYYVMHWPRICGLAASAGVRLRAKETEISADPWALTFLTKLCHIQRDHPAIFLHFTRTLTSKFAYRANDVIPVRKRKSSYGRQSAGCCHNRRAVCINSPLQS